MQSNYDGAGEAVPLKVRGKKPKAEIVTTTYEFNDPYLRKPKSKSLGKMVYDKEHGKILGRTPRNWGELLFFYTIFYIVLAALFAICMKGLMLTIDKHQPKWKLDESIIGTNPGLGFRPISHDVDQGSLIWYDSTNETQVEYWVERIDEFLSEYNKTDNQKPCNFDSRKTAKQVCALNLKEFGHCSRENSYGYGASKPCIFLKLNRIYGWVPEYYNDPNDLPKDMPESLKTYITNLPENQRNQVWVTCSGENGMDREIIGDAVYYPSHGFPGYFYPYTNNPGYVSPLVAVQFKRPALNRIINIECRTWAKNIKYSGSHRDRMGSVHFEIMIDADANPDLNTTPKPTSAPKLSNITTTENINLSYKNI
ncbi:hypothetical protein PVAND_005114 [Polypedilum vanderplanki]|uniref:Sodium/potassium-transporting ATPase subunit beta-2 n=1 Tax=Polypedilum vanderplanki TaxID=319348 RepID=A0A9J6C137_POLVA|nr:hypothetical protein PVAND_005114 [Polypedilum vanderplanki]